MATISDFAAHFRGGVRPNLFRVDIEGPEFFNNFHFFCKGAAIPASTVGVIAVPFRGRQLQVPGDRTFEPWTVTVLNDVDWQHRTAFENWSHRITAYSANVSNFDSGDLGYYGRATVIHLDRSGNVVRRYVLEDIFPSSVAAIDLTSDGNDAVEEYAVEFQINGVFSKSTGGLDATSGGLDIDVDLSVNATVGPISIGLNI